MTFSRSVHIQSSLQTKLWKEDCIAFFSRSIRFSNICLDNCKRMFGAEMPVCDNWQWALWLLSSQVDTSEYQFWNFFGRLSFLHWMLMWKMSFVHIRLNITAPRSFLDLFSTSWKSWWFLKRIFRSCSKNLCTVLVSCKPTSTNICWKKKNRWLFAIFCDLWKYTLVTWTVLPSFLSLTEMHLFG